MATTDSLSTEAGFPLSAEVEKEKFDGEIRLHKKRRIVPPATPRDSQVFLLSKSVMELTKDLKDGDIICISSESSVEEAFDILHKNGISSAPLFDTATDRPIGMIDMLDLVSIIVSELRHVNARSLGTATAEPGLGDVLLTDAMGYPVSWYMNSSRRDPWVPVSSRLDLLAIAKTLSQLDLHRVPILDYEKNAELVGLATQSSLIKFLQRHVDKLGSKRNKTVGQMMLSRPHMHNVVHVQQTDSVLHAFRQMYNKRVSGVAVFDENQHLVGCISASDLKLWTTAGDKKLRAFYELGMNVNEFLEKHKPESNRPLGVVACKVDSTLEDVLNLMVNNKVHRVFVTESQEGGAVKLAKSRGIVTMRDILYDIAFFVGDSA